MLPEAKGETLLYVSDPHRRKVFVYSYPQGKLVGMLEGFGTPQQECVDVSGDVWVTDFARLRCSSTRTAVRRRFASCAMPPDSPSAAP